MAQPLPQPKRCLVLGGTGAVGSAVLRVLQREKAQVVFTFHQNESKARALQSETGAREALACDLRDPKSVGAVVRDAAQTLGGLDAVIFAAGLPADQAGTRTSLETLTPEAFDQMLAVGTRGAMLAIQAAAPALRASGKEGRRPNLVVISSLNGVKMVPAPVHYAASKAALRGIVEAVAKDLGPSGVCANLIALGIVEEGVSKNLDAGLKANYLKHCSLGRFAKPSEAADVAGWFALENTYVTGQAILVEGGL